MKKPSTTLSSLTIPFGISLLQMGLLLEDLYCLPGNLLEELL